MVALTLLLVAVLRVVCLVFATGAPLFFRFCLSMLAVHATRLSKRQSAATRAPVASDRSPSDGGPFAQALASRLFLR